MKSGPHKLALPLSASVDIHLDGFRNSVVLGEILCVHAPTVGSAPPGRQRPNPAKPGRLGAPRPRALLESECFAPRIESSNRLLRHSNRPSGRVFRPCASFE